MPHLDMPTAPTVPTGPTYPPDDHRSDHHCSRQGVCLKNQKRINLGVFQQKIAAPWRRTHTDVNVMASWRDVADQVLLGVHRPRTFLLKLAMG